jgi:hypothetical protein
MSRGRRQDPHRRHYRTAARRLRRLTSAKLRAVPTAIDISSVTGLVALGILTAQILLGLLLSIRYNPIRQWPRQRWLKLFTFHN